MISQILMIFLAFSVSVVCAGRILEPFPSVDNPLMKKMYIVYVDFGLYHGDCKLYEQLLEKVIYGRSPKNALVYCYNEVISGFAAKLTYKEAEKLKGEKGVYDVNEETKYYIDEPHMLQL